MTNLLLLLALLTVTGASDFGNEATWDDGQAEVARYAAERVIYGTSWPHEMTLITVKEDFDLATLVKADAPFGERPIGAVLKLNAITSIDTGNYPYQMMTSCFVLRADPSHLLKVSASSQEWCGNTFKMLTLRDDKAQIEHHSYFDGELDGTLPVRFAKGDLVEDALPLQLRALPFAAGYRRAVRILELQSTHHASRGQMRAAEVVVPGREVVATGTGAIEAWQVEVRYEDGVDQLWFEVAFPHVLVKLHARDGRKLLLKERRRYAYWQR